MYCFPPYPYPNRYPHELQSTILLPALAQHVAGSTINTCRKLHKISIRNQYYLKLRQNQYVDFAWKWNLDWYRKRLMCCMLTSLLTYLEVQIGTSKLINWNKVGLNIFKLPLLNIFETTCKTPPDGASTIVKENVPNVRGGAKGISKNSAHSLCSKWFLHFSLTAQHRSKNWVTEQSQCHGKHVQSYIHGFFAGRRMYHLP